LRLSREFLGSAEIMPTSNITAGQLGSWEIEYTVGKYGIDDRGTIKIAWRNVSDWATPQFDEPMDMGYTTVTTTGNAKVKIENSKYQRPFLKCVMVYVYDGYLCEGDKVKIVFGDVSEGSPGIRAQTFKENNHEFKVLVDPYGARKYKEIPETLKVNILGGKAHEIQVIAPSIIKKDEEFDFVVRCIDEYGNPAEGFVGRVEFDISELNSRDYKIKESVVFSKGEKSVKRVCGNIIHKEAAIHISADCCKYGLNTISNGFFCKEKIKYNIYWGDMHGQNNLTLGTGTMDEYYSFARDFGAVDFSGWQGNDFEIDNNKWDKVRKKTQEYNEPGRFLTFLGYEWSGLTSGGGDHNVFFLDDNDKFYPSSNWLSEKEDMDNNDNAYPISELWNKLEGRKDVMAIPHVGGRHANFDYYNQNLIKLIEVHSHHGTFDWFALEAMKRKMKVGFVASSDDHTCRLGISYPLCLIGSKGPTSFDVISGLVGVYSKDLTKKSIWEALTARRCYASTFNRLHLNVMIDNHFMGEEIECEESPIINIQAIGSTPIENIEIYNGTELIHDKYLLEACDNTSNIRKIKILWSGVRIRTRSKSADWSGMVYVDNAKIIDAKEICFDRTEQGIKLKTDKFLEWSSSTSGDIDGLEIILDVDSDAKLSFISEYIKFKIDISDITDDITSYDAGGENLKVELSSANKEISDYSNYLKKCQANISYKSKDLNDDFNAYWVRVTQEDGNMAWSSPIFVNKK